MVIFLCFGRVTDCKLFNYFRLSQKRAIQGPKNRRPARNPLKTLAAREDLQREYTEIKTGVADRELKRMKLESSE